MFWNRFASCSTLQKASCRLFFLFLYFFILISIILLCFIELNIPFAKVGTGSSFAHPEGNVKAQHEENAVAIKEMECAAIAGKHLIIYLIIYVYYY